MASSLVVTANMKLNPVVDEICYILCLLVSFCDVSLYHIVCFLCVLFNVFLFDFPFNSDILLTFTIFPLKMMFYYDHCIDDVSDLYF